MKKGILCVLNFGSYHRNSVALVISCIYPNGKNKFCCGAGFDMNKFSLLFATSALVFAVISPAVAQSITEKEARALIRTYNSSFGCTRVKKRFAKAIIKFPDTQFAFVGRTAPKSITGIRGCGFAWGRGQSKVNARAMARCRKGDRRFGTKTGRTCKL